MCGIAGIWSFSRDPKSNKKYVEKMLASMKHRGPDASNVMNVGSLSLGHNRLKIVDLDARSNQPFESFCGNYVIVFNGEIFNYTELRKELDYPFRTTSDTEVLLAAFIKYGVDCLQKLNGMFAFSIFNKRTQRLFCARDRIGEKPFLYYSGNDEFHFASELPALLSNQLIGRELDEVGVAYSYLRNFRHIPDPYTMYRNIRRLEPAHAMEVYKGNVLRKWCYWTPSFDQSTEIGLEEIQWTISDAVKLRTQADVPVATLLSGGVDSSIISGIMVEQGADPLSFTLVSDAEEFSRARSVAELFNLELKAVHVEKETFFEHEARLKAIYGEVVRLDPLVYASILNENIHRNGYKVVMSGVGADEIFYGYDGGVKQLLFSDMLSIIEKLPARLINIFEKIFSSSNEMTLLFHLAKISNSRRKGVLYKNSGGEKFDSQFDFSILLDFWSDKCRSTKYIDVSNWVGLISENAHSITISSDLASMAHSIEARAPFLDHRVVDLAFSINAHKKIQIKTGLPNNKLILKKAFEYLLPTEILYSQKKGFGYGLQKIAK